MTVSEQQSSVLVAESAGTTSTTQPTTQPPFPIIGMGASAGGIEALEQLFAHMPPDSGMAFVVILHLSPTHESAAAAVLQAYTSMPVSQVTGSVTIEPDHVYVIPPAWQLSLVDGSLQLGTPADEYAQHRPINHFFQTLAETYGARAAAIVLSGLGTDGTLGVQQVKDHGGVTFAQDPEEAVYATMSRNAIATGRVDFVLPVAHMPAKLIEYWNLKNTIRPPVAATLAAINAEPVAAILTLVYTRTGYDFSHMPDTMLRTCIERRMQVHGVPDVRGYEQMLRSKPSEVQALLRDLLSGPGNFFKDVDAWTALAAIIPKLFANKAASDQVRVWVVGCGTGEEAYSVAILLHEYASTLEHCPTIRVFATDINEDAIGGARRGLFPQTIAADVSPERLQRCFMPESDGYRIRKEIRDLVLFAPHNLLRDPPFFRLDLIVCRNQLRYFTSAMQEQVLQLFHLILLPESYLSLGGDESAERMPDLFVPVDIPRGLFQRRATQDDALLHVPTLPLLGAPVPSRLAQISNPAPPSVGDLHQQLLVQVGPPSVIVDKTYTILNLSGKAGRFLALNDGVPSRNLLQLIHPDLRSALRHALLKAAQHNSSAEARRVQIELDGSTRLVDMIVHPVQEPEWARGCLMVVFHDLGAAGAIAPESVNTDAATVQHLEAELQRAKEQLKIMDAQYETALAEIKVAHEEVQAMHEEVRTVTENLGMREEDLMLVNQELNVVNRELKRKVDEISQTNNDLLNLMAATEIGTIFVDRDLRVKRYTPSAQTIFNLLPTDVNRPLAHITHKLVCTHVSEDVANVLETRVKIEREVLSQDGRWYLMRLLPYRTLEDDIEGVTLTFVDITERKLSDQHIRFQAQLLDNVEQAVIATDGAGRITYWNRFAEKLYGWKAAEVVGQPIVNVVVPEGAQPEANQILEHLQSGTVWSNEYTVRRRDGSTFPAFVTDAPIRDERGNLVGFVGVSADISVPKQTRTELQQALDEVHAAHAQLQVLSRRLLDVQETERRMIARELHDEIGQDLTGLSLRLLMIDPHDSAEAIRKHVQETQRQVNHIMAQVRHMSLDLRPPMLDDLGLLAALQWHMQRYTEQTHIQVIFKHDDLEQRRFASEVEITAYRMVQEALTNVARHAGVETATVQVWLDDGYLHVQIEDHGKGFEIDSKMYTSSGLSGMRERVQLLRGTLEVKSAPGAGTCIHATLPLIETSERQDESNEPSINRADQ